MCGARRSCFKRPRSNSAGSPREPVHCHHSDWRVADGTFVLTDPRRFISMKKALAAFLILSAISLVQATTLGLASIKLPLYLHGSDGDTQITFADVPFVSAWSAPEATFAAISRPFIPLSDDSWKEREDVNVVSVYGLRVSAADESTDSLSHWIITIDASAAKRPEGYPFTLEQVIDATTHCIKSMCPVRPEDEHKTTIKVVGQKKG